MSNGRQIVGSLAALRESNDLMHLERELEALQRANGLLRAQVHEFNNQLHSISGMIQMGRYGDVVHYIRSLSQNDSFSEANFAAQVYDRPARGLLTSKFALAAKRGVVLRITESTELAVLRPAESIDVVTVLGNLVDNAVDAAELSGEGGAWVEVEIQQDRSMVKIMVRDSGPGVTCENAKQVFCNGFTTKSTERRERGIGLALTRAICERRGGEVTFTTLSNGAMFEAVLNVAPSSVKRNEVLRND